MAVHIIREASTSCLPPFSIVFFDIPYFPQFSHGFPISFPHKCPYPPAIRHGNGKSMKITH